MRSILAFALVATMATPALSDAFMMGAGRWTCGQALQAWQGKPIDKGQLAGWILGYWSAATTTRQQTFVDTVQQVGGLKIVEATLSECRKAGPDVLVYQVTRGMVANTK